MGLIIGIFHFFVFFFFRPNSFPQIPPDPLHHTQRLENKHSIVWSFAVPGKFLQLRSLNAILGRAKREIFLPSHCSTYTHTSRLPWLEMAHRFWSVRVEDSPGEGRCQWRNKKYGVIVYYKTEYDSTFKYFSNQSYIST